MGKSKSTGSKKNTGAKAGVKKASALTALKKERTKALESIKRLEKLEKQMVKSQKKMGSRALVETKGRRKVVPKKKHNRALRKFTKATVRGRGDFDAQALMEGGVSVAITGKPAQDMLIRGMQQAMYDSPNRRAATDFGGAERFL